MSKHGTLATCIARMYEGAKTDNGRAASETPKKANPTLLGTLNTVEDKLSLLEGRVDQITSMQTTVLQKLDLMYQGLGALDQSLAQLRQDVLGQPTVKFTPEDAGRGNDNLATCTEVKALCGETVTLLKSLKQEGQLQRKEMQGIESSVSRLEKVFGWMGDAFHSSKIMEFILSNMVPWKKQGLLGVTEEGEKPSSEGDTGKGKAPIYHRGTQTPQEINEDTSAGRSPEPQTQTPQEINEDTSAGRSPEPQTQTPQEINKDTSAGRSPEPQTQTPQEIDKDTSAGRNSEPQTPLHSLSEHQEERGICSTDPPGPAGPSPGVGHEATGRSQRRAKEVTVQSREPGRAQAFTPQHEPEVIQFQELPPSVTVALTTVSQPERQNQCWGSQHTEGPAVTENSCLGSPESQKQESAEEQTTEKKREDERVSGEQKQGDVPQEPWPSSKLNMPVKENLESGVALATPQSRETKQEPESKLITQEFKPESADMVLEEHVMFQKDSEPFSISGTESPALCNGTQPKAPSLNKGSNSQPLIIDDCPPSPAPFEHRIVSAKQVPVESCYTVQLEAVLGGGRFGQVHKCAELSSGLTLAAKIIKVKGMKERDEVKNEIGIMNQLSHVNLIQLYDAFESRTNLTLIMEYVEGGELFDRIVDEHYHLTELDAIVFMRQICEGVQYLHQQYILHLDLKPENILCVSSTGNQIKIIDFGLARKYRPREKLKVNFGTPEFLAPEVVNYDFVSFPTDMWSVGVITYMLLSGLSPFLGESDTETMNNIVHANWDFDTEAFENVSEEAKDFISRLLVPAKCSRLSAVGCVKHSWLNSLEDKAKRFRVRLKSHLRLQRYLAAHRQWKKHFYAVAAANRLKRFQQSRSNITP